MTKEEAISASAKLLKNIYDMRDPSKINLLAAVLTAEADNNVEWLCSSLDKVIEFCDKLKKAMYNQV